MTTTLWNDERDKPLQSLRVIDLSVMLPGPLLTRLLAQYGAEVIKIEQLPLGDALREKSDSFLFELMNRGKQSVALDLKNPQAISIVKQLVNEADVFVENFREGIMEHLGLSYTDLSEQNPDLLYVSIRGFCGGRSTHVGHDLNFMASSGCGDFFLENGPVYSTQFADIVGGAIVPCLKLLLHLSNPQRRGMHLVSHIDESVRMLFLPRAYDKFKSQQGTMHGQNSTGWHQIIDGSEPHTRYYKCRDEKWVALNAVQTKHWEIFCNIVDRPLWKSRMHDRSLVSEMQRLFLDAPSTYWETLSIRDEVCLTRVFSWEEMLANTQSRQQLLADPFTWCGFVSNPALIPAPHLGQDTFSIIQTLGVEQIQMAHWIDQKILYQHEFK